LQMNKLLIWGGGKGDMGSGGRICIL